MSEENTPDLVNQQHTPKISRVTYTGYYGEDNLVNKDGSCNALRVEFVRTPEGDLTNVYLMKDKVVYAILNPEEVATCLLTFFLQNSVKEEGV